MQLTPEQVNEFIADAVLNSKIGEAVKASIDRVLKDLTKQYDNPFDAIVKAAVNDNIRKILAEKYQPELEKEIEKQITKYLTEDVVGKIIQAGISKLQTGY